MTLKLRRVKDIPEEEWWDDAEWKLMKARTAFAFLPFSDEGHTTIQGCFDLLASMFTRAHKEMEDDTKRQVQPQEIKEINVNDPEFPAFAANFFEPGGLSDEEIIEAINATQRMPLTVPISTLLGSAFGSITLKEKTK